MAEKVLITGGAGFIGGHLARALAAAGYSVVIVDRKQPSWTMPAGVRLVRADIREPGKWGAELEDVSALFHFAAEILIPVCEQDPLESGSINLWGTYQVLDELKKRARKKPRVVFASSSAVYGDPGSAGEAGITENTPTRPLSFYGAQKFASEDAVRLYGRSQGFPSLSFRFFNVYGAGQDANSPYSGVISLFSKRLAKGQDLMLNAGGINTRDFIHVSDIVAACQLALTAPAESLQGQAVNLGTGTSVSIRQLAGTMAELSGKPARLVDAPARSGDILHSLSNPTRAAEILGWRAQVSLTQGVREILTGS